MIRPRWAIFSGGALLLGCAGLLTGQRPVVPIGPVRPDAGAEAEELAIAHPECEYFGPRRERFISEELNRGGVRMRALSTLTLSLIHISEPTRLLSISYAVF